MSGKIHLRRELAPRILLASSTVGILIYLVISIFFVVLGTPGEVLFTTPQILINWTKPTIIVTSWSIIYFALHYFENYQKVEIERFIWEAAVKDFELKTLKSQLNPHFMFNAMNGIRSLIEEDPRKQKVRLLVFKYFGTIHLISSGAKQFLLKMKLKR